MEICWRRFGRSFLKLQLVIVDIVFDHTSFPAIGWGDMYFLWNLIGSFVSPHVVIGLRIYFGFDSTTLNWEPLNVNKSRNRKQYWSNIHCKVSFNACQQKLLAWTGLKRARVATLWVFFIKLAVLSAHKHIKHLLVLLIGTVMTKWDSVSF